ncbi:MAG: PilN domain-containing protein [Xanthomonadaceae bacterium]|nr:PilN domain-containing protein [Xanthomonadaceae bacterium]
MRLSAVSPDTTSPGTLSKVSSPALFKAGARLRGFWAWWMRGLASWVPSRLRAVFGLSQQRLLLQPDGDELRLLLTGRNETGQDTVRLLGRIPAELEAREGDDPLAGIVSARVAGLPRWLLLPASVGLRRRLPLPAAAADRLREVLAFEIDRQTPFAVQDVSYDARVLGRRGDSQIEAELVVVPKPALDRALDALSAPLRATLAGVDMIAVAPQPPQPKEPGDDIESAIVEAAAVEAAAAEAAGLDSLPIGVNLLPAAQRRHRRDPSSMLNLVLAFVAIAAFGVGLWQIRANRTAAADAFEQEANLRTKQAKRVSDEKKQLVDLVEGLRFLQNTRTGKPTTVEVLDELTRRLPDNTFIEKVSVEGDKLLVIGLSSEASRLVELLQTSKLWRSMSLTGALQPDPRSGKDRFTLTADLAIVAPPGQKGGDDARRNR